MMQYRWEDWKRSKKEEYNTFPEKKQEPNCLIMKLPQLKKIERTEWVILLGQCIIAKYVAHVRINLSSGRSLS